MNSLLRMAAASAFCLALTLPAAAAPPPQWNAVARDIYAESIAFRTVPGEGNQTVQMAEALAARFRAAGFAPADIHIIRHKDTAALVVRYRGDGSSGKKPILAIAHMDVVDALASDWSKPPFQLIEEDGYFYGRGTGDNKGGLVAIATAFLRLKAEGYVPARDIILEFSGDEETTGETTALLATQHRDLIDAEYALNADGGGGVFNADGKPLGFGLQTSEKTYATFTLTVRNRGGHSSGPRPDNAIYQLSAALTKLSQARFRSHVNDTTRLNLLADAENPLYPAEVRALLKRFAADPSDQAAADAIEANPNFTGSTRTTCVATMLAGGHAENALAQTAVATVNCRIFPGESLETVKGVMASAMNDPGVEIAQLGEVLVAPGSELRQDILDAYTRALRRNHPGVKVLPTMSLGASDGNILRYYGIPTYGVDGGWGVVEIDDRAHGRDERLPVKAFDQDLDHWYWMLKDLAGTGRARRR